MKYKYKHILFDLDRTLWDFEANNKITLEEVFDHFYLKKRCNCSFETFLEVYNMVNYSLWEDYKCGKLSKEILLAKRFVIVLNYFNVTDTSDAVSISDYYLVESPKKTRLLPYAKEILEYLTLQNYRLHIVTNGFKDIQHIKLNTSGIQYFFENIFTSEEIGFPKPDKRIFESILNTLNCFPQECVMIGDDFNTDILGARSANIDAVFVNFENVNVPIDTQTQEIFCLKDIKNIL